MALLFSACEKKQVDPKPTETKTTIIEVDEDDNNDQVDDDSSVEDMENE